MDARAYQHVNKMVENPIRKSHVTFIIPESLVNFCHIHFFFFSTPTYIRVSYKLSSWF